MNIPPLRGEVPMKGCRFHRPFTSGARDRNAARAHLWLMNPRTVAVEIDEAVLYGDDRCPICAASHRTDAPVGSERILVAEDEPSVASLITYNLEQDGYRVTVAGDGEEALRALVSSPPELLVLDLLLPLRSGWQVLREMRTRRGLADLPVLVVSALACERLGRQLAALGAQAVIGKPFSVQELRDTVRRLIAGRHHPFDARH
jgi:CheY-like chemotaxis protein